MTDCAPAEATAAPVFQTSAVCSSAERKLKCRKCRHQLLQEPPHQLFEEQEEGGGTGADAAVYSLQEEGLPDWINAAIEQVSPHWVNFNGIGSLF